MGVDGLGRFSDPALFILVSLADGPKHGYSMIEDIQNMTDVKLGPGTLYGAITRLEERGLIEALPSEDRRQPYKLTAAGAEILEERLNHMNRFITTGLGRLSEA